MNATAWSVAPNGFPGPALRTCLEAAIAAPSVHNTQPWRFQVRDGAIDVYADQSRRLPVLDPHGRELFISLGAAVLNLRVAILAHGRVPMLRILPDPEDPQLAARVTLGQTIRAYPTARLLAEAIPRRHTNRRPFSDIAVPAEVLTDLAEAATAEGARLAVADPYSRDAVLGLVRTAETRRHSEQEYLDELKEWTTMDPARGDGVPKEAFGPWSALETLPMRDFGLAQPGPRRAVDHFENDPTLAVLYTSGDTPRDWLRAGQALERVLLTATVRGLATTPLTQPVEIPELRALLGGEEDGSMAQVILRLGYGPPTPRSPRRPLADVLVPAHTAASAPHPATAGNSVASPPELAG